MAEEEWRKTVLVEPKITFDDAVGMIRHELNQAIRKHPVLPKDIIYAVAIMAEEAGEAVKAANNLNSGEGSISELKIELAHTGAMCIRCLMSL